MGVSRREFLKASAAAAALAAASGGVSTAVAGDATAAVAWGKAPCRFCGTGCHVQVGVAAGKVVAIKGDPQAEVNRGMLCVKGYHVGASLYGRDRLTRPLLRVNGKLRPISWERAIDVLARRISAAPERFGIYGSGQWTIPEGYAAQKFIKGGLSNNNIDPNARLCMASAVTGFLATYGVDEPAGCYDDLDRADVVICWGNNPAEMHPILFSRFIDRRLRGEKVTLIDIGTRRTRTTAQADHYLPFVPNTDLAIANGIIHELLRTERWDRDFVAKHCAFRKGSGLFGEAATFDELRAHAAKWTPERVESVSGVPATKIRMLADLFGDPKLRITSLWCMGVNQHTSGTAMNTLIHGVHLLSGHFGKPGDAPTSLTGQPSACGTAREVGTLCHALPGGRLVAKPAHRADAERIWNLPTGRVAPKPGLHTVAMWRDFTSKTGSLDAIWVQVSNPGQSLPNLRELFTNKPAGKFLIVSDVYPTATTELADLVLPSALWVEKNGLFGNSERRTQQWFKMVQPPGEARDDAWQIIAVARRLWELGHAGMRDKDGRFLFSMRDRGGKEVPVWQWKRYYDINVDERLFNEYRLFSRLKHKDLAPYSEYVRARGLRWPVVQGADGRWNETRFRFSEGHDPYVKAGAGVQFYHSTTKNDRAQIWIRDYQPPPEVPDAKFPLWLCTGRVLEHWHTGTLTMRIPQTRGSMPNAYVEMHPDDATNRGLQTGDIVNIASRRGSLALPVWIGGRGAPERGSVFVPFFDELARINELTLDAHDPISKQPDYKKCAVQVTKRAVL